MNGRKFTLYEVVVTGVAAVIVIVLFISALNSSVSPIPDPLLFAGPVTHLLFMLLTVVVWRVVIRRLRVVYWTRAGAESSLAPDGRGYRSLPIPVFTAITNRWPTEGVREGDGPLTLPTFTGTVDGTSVRATLGRRDYETEGQNRERNMHTVVEADLERDTHEGVIIASLSGDTFDHGYAPFAVEDNADVADDELAAAATSSDLAEAVLSGRAREALLECERLEQVYAGDITAVYDEFDTESTASGGRMWKAKQIVLDAHGENADIDASTEWAGGTASVSHPIQGTIVDPEELEAQIQAVAAVARAFDDARRW